jgi:hypothetical protein
MTRKSRSLSRVSSPRAADPNRITRAGDGSLREALSSPLDQPLRCHGQDSVLAGAENTGSRAALLEITTILRDHAFSENHGGPPGPRTRR